MSLFLIETNLNGINTKEAIHDLIDQIGSNEAEVVEVQVAKDFHKAYFILESNDETTAQNAFQQANQPIELIKEVRLVGKDLAEVKQANEKVNYLVEWELPEHLTMDQYLERKKKNSVYYEEVPEVTFSRTYVCEDMTKCLCFYNAPNEASVKRAREAVKAPITSLTKLEN